jgi:hypothetical protein
MASSMWTHHFMWMCDQELQSWLENAYARMVETLVMQHGLSPEDLLGFHQIQAELDSLEAIDDACSKKREMVD